MKGYNRLKELSNLYLNETKCGLVNMSPEIIINSHKKVIKILVRTIISKIISIISHNYHNGLNPKSILLIESTSNSDGFGIGDGIFKIPAIEALSEHFQAEIELICFENRKDIFDGNPYISTITTTEGDNSISQVVSIIKKVLFKKYNLIISLTPGTKIQIIKLLAGINTPYINKNIINTSYDTNHIQRNIKVISEDIPEFEKYKNNIPKIYLDEETIHGSQDKLKNIKGTKIAIFIGAINGLKDYKKYDKIIEGLNESEAGLNFILIGAPKDKNTAEILSNKFENIINFVGKTTLKEAFGLINEMDLCIGSDGSLTNATIALKKKLVVIFSIIEPELIIANTVKNVEIVLGDCPNKTRCHQTSTGKKCSVTGQINRNFSDTPPCLENINNEEIIIKAIELKNKKVKI